MKRNFEKIMFKNLKKLRKSVNFYPFLAKNSSLSPRGLTDFSSTKHTPTQARFLSAQRTPQLIDFDSSCMLHVVQSSWLLDNYYVWLWEAKLRAKNTLINNQYFEPHNKKGQRRVGNPTIYIYQPFLHYPHPAASHSARNHRRWK